MFTYGDSVWCFLKIKPTNLSAVSVKQNQWMELRQHFRTTKAS